MARYQRQMNIALERLDQSLATLHTLIKRGENQKAISFMNEQLRENYEDLENMINITSNDDPNQVGHLR